MNDRMKRLKSIGAVFRPFPFGDIYGGRSAGTSVRRLVGLLLCFLPVLVACFSAPSYHAPTLTPPLVLSPSPSPVPLFTPTPIPPPTLTPVPTATPTSTPAPTIAPAVVEAVVTAGRTRFEIAGVEPLCLRWEDTDGDEGREWVGLYVRPEEPPRLAAFVLDGDAWYDLRPLDKAKHGLGEYPTCELEVRDVNADGRVEILVWGHAEASIDLLHIFAWDGESYLLLAPFEGEAGVRLENEDGDLADEVVVAYDAGKDLIWEAIYTWDGANYGWTWERYAWFYLARPHAYPVDTSEHAVISFYLAVNDRDLPGAYGLLSGSAQAAQSYEAWAAGFASTVAVEVGAVHELARDGDVATVAAQVRALDNVDGRIIATLWDVKWSATRTDVGWRLESVSAAELDRWELSYYP